MTRRRARRLLGRAALALLLAVLLAYTLFPFYWAIVSSLKTGTALFRPQLLPPHPTFANYRGVFTQQPFALNIANSAVVASCVVLLSLALSALCGFGLGRFTFRGRRALLLAILGVSMFPQVAVLSGMFELIRALGLYNTRSGLVLADLVLTLPFTIWTITTYMRALPRELEEAAVIDGAKSWQILLLVFLPLLAPALATTGLLAFIAAWNEFLFALTFTLDRARTVPVAISQLSGASQHELPWGTIMAASVIVTVPLILLVLAFQRRIVAGLMAGAVKG
jgi:trehalose/maltose transport system permease protein